MLMSEVYGDFMQLRVPPQCFLLSGLGTKAVDQSGHSNN